MLKILQANMHQSRVTSPRMLRMNVRIPRNAGATSHFVYIPSQAKYIAILTPKYLQMSSVEGGISSNNDDGNDDNNDVRDDNDDRSGEHVNVDADDDCGNGGGDGDDYGNDNDNTHNKSDDDDDDDGNDDNSKVTIWWRWSRRLWW